MKECLDFSVDLTSYFSMNLQWVPGYCDIPGNYEADELQLDSEKEGNNMTLTTCRYFI